MSLTDRDHLQWSTRQLRPKNASIFKSEPLNITLPDFGSLPPHCPPPHWCADCEQHFRGTEFEYSLEYSYNKRLSYHEAESIVAGHVKSIKDGIASLQNTLGSYGDILLSRWKKKGNPTKREAWLHKVDPDMFQHQWFLPYFSRHYAHLDVLQKRKALWQVLRLPYLTVESLAADPNKLIGILHHRAYSLPEDWVTHDSRQLNFGWYSGLFGLDFSDVCVTMHGPRWGELTEWDEAAAHRFSIVGFPRASLILEAQSTLLSILNSIVKQVLVSADGSLPTASGKTRWMAAIEDGFKHASTVELRSPYTNCAFSAPRKFDINEILSIAHARLDAAMDHLCLLQTDPSYMRWALNTYTLGEMVCRMGKDMERNLSVGEILRSVQDVQRWQWLVDECEYLKQLYISFRDQIHPSDRLPPKYDRTLGAIRLLVTNQVLLQAQQIEIEFPQKPGFSKAYNFESADNGGVYCRTEVARLDNLFWDDTLEWLMIKMVGNFQEPNHYDQEVLFAILEDHLQKSTTAERGRLDARLYAKVADFSAQHEILYLIDSHRPLDTNPYMEDLKKSESNRSVWRFMAAKQRELSTVEMSCLADLLDQFREASSSPPPKHDTKLSLEVLDKSREALTAFWTALRDVERDTWKSPELLQKDLDEQLQVLSPASFREYTQVIEAQRAALACRVESQTKSKLELSCEGPQTVWGTNEDDVGKLGRRVKTKLKMRPTSASEPSEKVKSEPIFTNPLPKVQPLPVPAALKARTLAVFSRMFPEHPEETQKSVDWADFVLAMNDIGFTARQNGGSAVTFDNEQASRKIVFHRPHPIAKIGPVMTRAMGFRLRKWFGWSRSYLGLSGVSCAGSKAQR